MKVILTEEVYNLGYKGDVVDVADGYGRNFLIPRGLAIRATDGALRQARDMTRARKVREAATLDSALEFQQEVEARRVRIEMRVDERGTLYGSVSAADVERVLKERGVEVERRRIDLSPIKQIGEYQVPIRLHPQVVAHVTVEVVDVEGEVLTPEQEEAKTLEERALEAAAAAESPGEAGEEEPAGPGQPSGTEDAGEAGMAATASRGESAPGGGSTGGRTPATGGPSGGETASET